MIIHHLPLLKKRTMLVSLYFDTKNLRSANFSRIVITILVYAAGITVLLATLAHNIPTSESLKGKLP